MKIGMEHDPVEELDREEELAIAALIRARVNKGDVIAARRAVEAVSVRRMAMRRSSVRRYA